jgi:hypothetical protein
MYSQALIAALADEWTEQTEAATPVAPVGCIRCSDSDLVAVRGPQAHARTHGLVAAIEEILDEAVDEYVNDVDPHADRDAWERRLESVDSYRDGLRSQARLVVSAALARVPSHQLSA